MVEMIALTPYEFSRPGYAASVSYDPEGYDHSDREDELDSGWFNFHREFIQESINLEGLNGIWDTYDAGSIFYGDYESVKRLTEVLCRIKEEHGGFDICAAYADFSKAEIELEEADLNCFMIEGSDGSLDAPDKINISLETDYQGNTFVWVSPGSAVFEPGELLLILMREVPGYGFRFDPDWIPGDGCVGNHVEICPPEDVGIYTIAHQVAKACGLEVIKA